MAILINENTRYLIQGITGKEGQRALKWMQNLGSVIVAGVTPGKGGQEVAGIPVYNSVSEAIDKHPEINATCVYAPPKFAAGAATEAVKAGIELVHVIAENIPTKDTANLLELVREKNAQAGKQVARVVGPSSIGVLSPGESAMGSLGAGSDEGLVLPHSDKASVNKEKGGVVVLAKSGGMSLTVSHMISAEGIAISTIVGLGGDKISCTTYADLLEDIEHDSETWGVVIVGEIGGSYEEDLAAAIQESKFSKPVVAFISGKFAEHLPQGVAFGHAGAIVSKDVGTRSGKITALENAGALIAESPDDIVELLKTV